MSGIKGKIFNRIRGYGRGKRVYTPRDFLDLGNRAAVDQALSRLVKAGQLRRIGRGLYDYPRISRTLNRKVPPSADAVAAAIAGHDADVMLDGAASANALGLTNAVAAKASFITNGRTGSVNVDGRTIHLKQAPRGLMRWMGHPGAPVVQALDWLGRRAADDPQVVTTLRTRLPANVKNDLRKGIGNVPVWAQDILREVVAREGVDNDQVAA